MKQGIQRSRSQKKMYPPLYTNQLNIFDHDRNVYQEKSLQQKKRVSPINNKSNQTTSRLRTQRAHSMLMPEECFPNQVLKRSEITQMPRQISPLRYKISEEEPLMKKKKLVTQVEDRMRYILTDVGDESYRPKSGRMHIQIEQTTNTPKFSCTGVKTGYPAVKSDPITQGVDYRKLNQITELSPHPKQTKYKWQEDNFFKRGFKVFTESTPQKQNQNKYKAQRSSKVRELMNQENQLPVTYQIKVRDKDQIKQLLQDDLEPLTPKRKDNRDFKGDQITKLLAGEYSVEPLESYKGRKYDYSAQRQNYNIFKSQIMVQDASPTNPSTSRMKRNNSQNMKSLLQQD